MKELISIIVPCYNEQEALPIFYKTIKPILEELPLDHELVLVDDGSKDRSTAIVEKYVEQYSNMKLVKQSNKGVSAARNRGIEEATGEYIAFFDADDIAQKSLYEELLDLMVMNEADLSCVNYSMCFPDGVTKIHKKKEKKLLYDDEIIKLFLSSNILCNNTIDKLFDDKKRYEEIHNNSLKLGIKDSSSRIYDVILKVIGDNNG